MESRVLNGRFAIRGRAVYVGPDAAVDTSWQVSEKRNCWICGSTVDRICWCHNGDGLMTDEFPCRCNEDRC